MILCLELGFDEREKETKGQGYFEALMGFIPINNGSNLFSAVNKISYYEIVSCEIFTCSILTPNMNCFGLYHILSYIIFVYRRIS